MKKSLVALLLGIVSLTTLSAIGNQANEYGWPRLPTDAEIEQAASDVLAYVSTKTGDSDRYSYGAYSGVRIVKMHKPAIMGAPDAIDASMAWLLYTSTWIQVIRGNEMRHEPMFHAELLLFKENIRNDGFRPISSKANGWYFGDGHHSNSQEERDRYVQGWFDGFHYLPGFGWEHGESLAREPTANWQTAVGAGAAGAAAIAAAAKVIASIFSRGNSQKKNAKDKKSDPDEAIGYVLQLSTEQIDLSSGAPQPLTVTAWAVDAKGGYRPAPRAPITVTPSGAAASAVSVSPANGTGTLNCKVSMGQGASSLPEGDNSLEVTVSAPGGGSGAARVRLTCAAQPVMEFF